MLYTIITGILTIAITVTISVSGLLFVRRYVKPPQLQKHHDVAGFILAIVGVIYGVLQAFVVFVVWTQYDNAKTSVDNEAGAVISLYRLTGGYSPTVRDGLKGNIRNYVQTVIADEWPAMAKGKASHKVDMAIDRMWNGYLNYEPKTSRENAIYQESLTKLTEISADRQYRLLASRDGVPGILWFALIFGGVATVVFTYFFGVENIKPQIIMTVLLTLEIAIVLFLIEAIDYPFTGGVRIDPGAFSAASARFNTISFNVSGH